MNLNLAPFREQQGGTAARMPREPAAWRRALLPAVVALSLAGAFPAAAQSADVSKQTDFAVFKMISERNIFDPNRRPRIIAGPAPKIVDSFSLAGTMMYGKGQFAVFDGSSSDYRKVVEPGGSIAGYAVTDIGLDAVKLAAGTNRVEIKVGMLMRRNEDGQWSVGEQTEWPSRSRASGYSRRSGGRRASSPAATQSESSAEATAAEPAEGAPPEMAEGANFGEEPGLGATNAPSENVSGDLNDPVARMMRRRAQELNGNDNRNPNQ